jgi:hypothetical protein
MANQEPREKPLFSLCMVSGISILGDIQVARTSRLPESRNRSPEKLLSMTIVPVVMRPFKIDIEDNEGVNIVHGV